MRLFFIIIVSFLAALLLEILPVPGWAIWLKPCWVEMVLIFWVLAFPYHMGVLAAFLVGLAMDLLMSTLLGEHAAVFVIIAYIALRFHVRVRLFPLWQQAALVFILVLICQTFLSWANGLLGGFRADAWFWLPALTSGLVWPWLNTVLKSYTKRYRIYNLYR